MFQKEALHIRTKTEGCVEIYSEAIPKYLVKTVFLSLLRIAICVMVCLKVRVVIVSLVDCVLLCWIWI